jgi:hypothetical protein
MVLCTVNALLSARSAQRPENELNFFTFYTNESGKKRFSHIHKTVDDRSVEWKLKMEFKPVVIIYYSVNGNCREKEVKVHSFLSPLLFVLYPTVDCLA